MQKQFECPAITLALRVLGYLTSVLLAILMLINHALASTPTVPENISITSSGGSELVITWTNSVDSDGVVAGYELVKNGTAQWLGNVTRYRDSAVSPGITYAYAVVAIDNEGRRSGMSNTVTFRFSQSSHSGSETSSGGSVSVGVAGGQGGACVDPDGDGWGWDGENSCKITTQSSGTESGGAGTCIDEDGDGYGWDGYHTCLIDQNPSSSVCVDTDGDGYGWDGQTTCIP